MARRFKSLLIIENGINMKRSVAYVYVAMQKCIVRKKNQCLRCIAMSYISRNVVYFRTGKCQRGKQVLAYAMCIRRRKERNRRCARKTHKFSNLAIWFTAIQSVKGLGGKVGEAGS